MSSDHIEPPRASPEPPRIGEDEHPSGSHFIPVMQSDLKEAKKAVEAHVEILTNQKTQSLVKTVKTLIFAADAKWAVGIIAATVLSLAYASSTVDRKVDVKMVPLQTQITQTAKELEEHKKVEAAAIAELKADAKESVRASSRAEVMVQMLVENRGLTPPPKILLDGGK